MVQSANPVVALEHAGYIKPEAGLRIAQQN